MRDDLFFTYFLSLSITDFIEPPVFAGLGVVSAIGSMCSAALAPCLSAQFGLRTLRVAVALFSVPVIAAAIACDQLPGPNLTWIATQSFGWGLLASLATVAGAEVLPRTVSAETMASVGAAQRTFALGILPIAALFGGTLATFTGSITLLCTWALLAAASALPILRTKELGVYR